MSRIVGLFMILFLSFVSSDVAAAERLTTFDAGRTARLSIHKTKSSSDTAMESLSGVVFRINRVEGIDLSLNEGWGAIAGIDASEIQHQPDKLGIQREATTVVTDAGTTTAVFNDIPLGVYLVTEQPARIGDVSYSVTSPFLVALPMNMESGWEYDVVVQAKTQPISLTKTASVEKAITGEQFTYQLGGTIPAPDRQSKLYRYIVKDTLPQGVDYVGTSLRIDGKNAFELGETIDYTVAYDAQRHEVTISFTEDGLGLLAAQRSADVSAHVRADIQVKVRGNAGEKLDNTAVLYPDGYNPDSGGGIPSNKHRLDVVAKPSNNSDGSNKDRAGAGSKNPPMINSAIPGAPDGGDGASTSKDKDSVLRVGSLALTGAEIYRLCIAGAMALFAGAALIYYRDKKQRKAKP